MSKSSNTNGNRQVLIAAGTLVTAIIGTSFAAPAAIGAGVCMVIWGITKLKKS